MKPMSKAHSQKFAEEHIRLGWTLKREFRASDDDEPYEYYFEWERDEPPKRPSSNPDDWGR